MRSQAISDPPVDGPGFADETCTSCEHTRQAYMCTLWNMLALNVSPEKNTCVLMTAELHQAKAEQSLSGPKLNSHN